MGLKTSGDTMQSPNYSSRRCAHVSVIFSPPGFALPMVGAGREAIVFTARYVMQRGVKAGHTVGIRRTGQLCRPVLLHPCAEFLVAVLLVEEVVGRVRHKRLLTDVC